MICNVHFPCCVCVCQSRHGWVCCEEPRPWNTIRLAAFDSCL